MLEGFIHLKKKLPREYVKRLVSMDCQYFGYAKRVLFIVDENKAEDCIKKYIRKRFAFMKDYVENIVLFLKEKENKSKTLLFNYKNN